MGVSGRPPHGLCASTQTWGLSRFHPHSPGMADTEQPQALAAGGESVSNGLTNGTSGHKDKEHKHKHKEKDREREKDRHKSSHREKETEEERRIRKVKEKAKDKDRHNKSSS